MALVLWFYALPAPAQVVPGKWQKVDALPAGTQIIIKTNYGEIVDCVYFSSDRETLLIVETNGGVQRRIFKPSVEKVTAKNYDDRLTNGAILGLSTGAALGVVLSSLSGREHHSIGVSDRLLGGVVGGLLGLGLGIFIDSQHKGREVLYEAAKRTDH